jgi:hypothetical protein
LTLVGTEQAKTFFDRKVHARSSNERSYATTPIRSPSDKAWRSICGCTLNGIFAAFPSLVIILQKPAALTGTPRSLKGPRGEKRPADVIGAAPRVVA